MRPSYRRWPGTPRALGAWRLGVPGRTPPQPPLPGAITLRPPASSFQLSFLGLVATAARTGARAFGSPPKSADAAIGLLLLPTATALPIGGEFAIASRDVISASLMVTFSGVRMGTGIVLLAHPPEGPRALATWYLCICLVIARLISAARGKRAVALVPVVGQPTSLATGIWLLVGGRSLARAVGVPSVHAGRCRPIRGLGTAPGGRPEARSAADPETGAEGSRVHRHPRRATGGARA